MPSQKCLGQTRPFFHPLNAEAHKEPEAPEPGASGVEPPALRVRRTRSRLSLCTAPRAAPTSDPRETRSYRSPQRRHLLPTRAKPHAHSEAAKPAPIPLARRGHSGPRLRRLLPPGPGISLHFASDHHGSAPANKSAAHWEERPPTLGVGDPRDKHREGPDLACKTHLQPPTLVLQDLRVPSSPSAGYDSSLSIFNIIDIVQWEKSVRHKKAEHTPWYKVQTFGT
ncbi:uncharacterized protein LOC143442489 [Arvicanthis niloticus]|uniref:uncharacterized protein LOC143312716 n=1 Tax=Arvicanthis niloticus TaxID=61156 RepID=UPI00402B793A